jgi:hypothetical protein
LDGSARSIISRAWPHGRRQIKGERDILPQTYYNAEAPQRLSDLTVSAKQFIERIEHETQVPVTLISTSAHTADMIDLRTARQPKAEMSHWLVYDSD